MNHRFERQIEIETVNPFDDRVGNHRYGVIPDHRVRLVRREFPHRQATALLELTEKGLDKVARPYLVDHREQRVQRTEGVPKREDRVVRKTLGPVDLEIASAILSVDVHVDVRRQHRVIHRRVEHDPLVARAPLDTDLRQLALPCLVGRPADAIEVPPWHFRVEIASRAVDTHRGYRDLDEERLAAAAEIKRPLMRVR